MNFKKMLVQKASLAILATAHAAITLRRESGEVRDPQHIALDLGGFAGLVHGPSKPTLSQDQTSTLRVEPNPVYYAPLRTIQTEPWPPLPRKRNIHEWKS